MTENDARAGARAGAGQHSRQWQAGKPAGSPGSATARPGETTTRPGETATRAAGTATGTGGTAKDAASGGAGKRAADLLPSVSLPKGGGAVRGLGERFSVDAATGTAAMAVPVPLSPGRSGFTPSLDLAYDSASGNGPLGFGWSLGVPAISRKTSKGLPQYRDGDESDVFLLAGADDLVPVLDQAGQFLTVTRTVHKTPFRISYYRPRVEGLFARIERWTATRTGLSHWRTISRDNVTALYGTDPASTVVDPADPSRIFAWNICLSWDDLGNAAVYGYIAEDSAGVDQSAASEANRTKATRASQVYLKTIQYGNPQPYFPDWTSDTPTELPASWMFKVVLDYGDHGGSPPAPGADQPWALRPDPFSSYRAGFDVRSYRRVERLLFFHNFPGEPTAGPDCLTRSLDLVYSDQQAPPDPRSPQYTFLVKASLTGHRDDGQGPLARSMPPLEFSYSQPRIQPDVLALDAGSLGNLPEGLDDANYQWIDLDGEGLSGILSDARGGWYYKRNLSAGNLVPQPDGSQVARARFGPLREVAELPSRSDLSSARLLDLSGSGKLDVVDLAGPEPGFFERTEDGGFEPFRPFAALPVLDWSDPNVKFIDVTGDGLADVLMTEEGLFTVHASLAEDGFDAARLVRTGWDEERGPSVVLADGTQTIFTADLSGDGLSDIVRVRNGEACYWPNTGYGRFGAKVTMDDAPRFDSDERFDPRRVRLADIDGSGTADLLYVGEEGVTAWFNQSGNAWSAPTVIAVFPAADQLSTVQVIDLLGTGTSCLAWSSPLPGQAAAPLLYVDLMGGVKPHLMTGTLNNLGAETRVTYAPSTRFYLDDEQAGRPWATRLPFPVQVVERVETVDWIGRNRLVSRYAYHHGYFDGHEREFRGFGMVEQWDTEEFRADTAFADGEFVNWDAQSWSPPVLTRTWFHTGVFPTEQPVTQHYLSEYWTEPALLPPSRAADAAAMRLPGPALPDELSALETGEAYRALKGLMLRSETYADDGNPAAANPYTVTEQNYSIRCLQHLGPNPHAVFDVQPREALAFHYERGTSDPCVGHEITLAADGYGNVLRSASVSYPRRPGYVPPEPALPAATQQMLAYDQARLHVTGAGNDFTNPIDDLAAWPDAYRAPLPSSSDVAEITGAAPTAKGTGITDLFTFDELDSLWQAVWNPACDVPFEQIPGSDVDGSGSPAAAPTRRVITQDRVSYRSDDLTALLPVGQLDPLALPGQSYRACLTPGLVSAIFGGLVPDATLAEGGYVQLAGETGWWAPSGRVYFSAGDADTPAQERAVALGAFFAPRRAVDPFGAISRAALDSYALLPVSVTDPVGNLTISINDYRVLTAATVTDANGNRVSAAFDVLGEVTAMAVAGKASETAGDLLEGFAADLDDATLQAQFADPLADPGAILGSATARFVYDLGAYQRTASAAQPSPSAVYVLARETHVSDLPPGSPQATRYQHHFSYFDGFGRSAQDKALVSPGPLSDGGPAVSPRWDGSGWTIFDNKGRAVRRYEPFFSAANGFEFAAQAGVATAVCYDPPGRPVATLYPDASWEKAVFGSWQEQHWDRDDTAAISDPRADADVGDHFRRVLGAGPFTSWYDLRIGGTFGATAADRAAQQDAAAKAAAAAATPAVIHRDAAGRACLAVADNGGGSRQASRTAYDTQGLPLAVFDPLGRRAEEYCYRAPAAGGGLAYLAGADMSGQPLYHVNADGGARRGLVNVAGRVIRAWDFRDQVAGPGDHAYRVVYDLAQRPERRYISTGGAGEILAELSVYGEGLAAANLCGRLFRHYDLAGYSEYSQFDFKGNLLASARQLAAGYQQAVNWTPLAGLTAAAQLDSAAVSAGLVPSGDGGRDRFTATAVYDALDRPVQQVTPHNATMRPDVVRPGYDQAGLLSQVDVWLQQAAAPAALLDPATADLHPVTSLDYNARGQRVAAAFGNGVSSAYDYDPLTFRLAHLTTTRPATFPVSQRAVQALAYYYDPVGNITRIADSADTQDVIFFKNQRVEPSASYTYDPLYRLVAATGREHLGQTAALLSPPGQVTSDDSVRTGLPQPGDGNAMGTYTEAYSYDPAGNLLAMSHQVSSGSWTRRYSYAEPSLITAAETGNRLSKSSLPGDPAGGPYTGNYAYDPRGNLTLMPHLASLTWDEDGRLRSTARQAAGAGTPQTAYYVYDGGGQRVRKATDRQAPAGQAGSRKSERIYLGPIEIYREYAPDGTAITLERETLRASGGDTPVAVVEIRTAGQDKAPAQRVRYTRGNHLGSAVLELDDLAGIISYEEYFPFGATSYQAVDSQTDLPKRYRYTGKERDEENDLYYHGARYYAPWLGRWTACDPAGLADGVSLYAFCQNNPIRLTDPDGLAGREATQQEKATLAGRGITDPGIVHGLVNLQPRHAPAGRGHGGGGHAPGGGRKPGGGGGRAPGGGGSGGGGSGGGGTPGGGSGGGGPPGSGGPPGGGPPPGGGQGPGGPGPGGQGPGGTGAGKGPADPKAPHLTELDYAVLLAGLLAPLSGNDKDPSTSGGIPGGHGKYASPALQGLYIAVNLAFTFLGEQIEKGLRKAGGALKSGLAKLWNAIGPTVKEAVIAPAFMFLGAGGLGGGHLPPRLGPGPAAPKQLRAAVMNLGPEGKAVIPGTEREVEAMEAALGELLGGGGAQKAGNVGHDVLGAAGPGQGPDFVYPGGVIHEVGFTGSWEGAAEVTLMRKITQVRGYLAQGRGSQGVVSIYNVVHGLVIRFAVK